MIIQIGNEYEFFVRVHHLWLTGIDFIDRENRFYMIGEHEADKLYQKGYQIGDCLLLKATIAPGSDGVGRILLKNVTVLKNYGAKTG